MALWRRSATRSSSPETTKAQTGSATVGGSEQARCVRGLRRTGCPALRPAPLGGGRTRLGSVAVRFPFGSRSVFGARKAARAAAVSEASAESLLDGALWWGLMEVVGPVPGADGLARLSIVGRYETGAGLLVVRPDAVVFRPRDAARSQGVAGWSVVPTDIGDVRVIRQSQGPRLITIAFRSGVFQRFASVDYDGLREAVRAAGGCGTG